MKIRLNSKVSQFLIFFFNKNISPEKVADKPVNLKSMKFRRNGNVFYSLNGYVYVLYNYHSSLSCWSSPSALDNVKISFETTKLGVWNFIKHMVYMVYMVIWSSRILACVFARFDGNVDRNKMCSKTPRMLFVYVLQRVVGRWYNKMFVHVLWHITNNRWVVWLEFYTAVDRRGCLKKKKHY